MDIKIGNDVKLTVYIPEYIDPSSILRITAHLHRTRRPRHHHHDVCHGMGLHCHHNYSDLYYPTEYTMHKHSCVPYNVLPRNVVFHMHGCCLHYHDHCNYRHRADVITVKPTGLNYFNLWLSNTTHHDCGTYILTVNIQTYEDGWDSDNVHEYTVYYGPVFSISNCRDAKEGDIEIIVSKGEIQNPDIDNQETVLLLNVNGEVLYNTGNPVIIN